ncbi:MAG: hypothetical protein ABJG33_00145 [Balneola sp.]
MKFSEYNQSDITKKIESGHKLVKDDFDENTLFFEGDHYQDGNGWSGALPFDSKNRTSTLAKIQALFTSQNVISEVVERMNSAVLGKDPEWNIHLKRALKEEEKPTDKEQEVIDETEQLMNEWWNTYDIHGELIKYLNFVALGSKAVLRIYVPSSFAKDNVIASGDFQEQLAKIRVEAISVDKATVYTDRALGESAGMLSYKEEDDNLVAEICYVDDKGKTILKTFTDNKENESDPFNLDGNLLMYQTDVNLFVTLQVRQLQKAVNKAYTMMNSNLDNGFLERIFLNAEPPGTWTTDESGKQTFVPDNLELGANMTNFISGAVLTDSEGKETITKPSVVFREPVSNESFITAKETAYEGILEQVHQKHSLISGDASPSGESRIQALVDFMKSCDPFKSAMDKAGKWLIETVMYLAFDLANEESKIEEYTADFMCRLDVGHLPAEMRNQIIKEYESGFLSRETAMSMLGVDDVDAEISRIDSATMEVKEILGIMNDSRIMPKTVVIELFQKLVEDKSILSALVDGEKKTALEGELESILVSKQQEDTLLSQLGV